MFLVTQVLGLLMKLILYNGICVFVPEMCMWEMEISLRGRDEGAKLNFSQDSANYVESHIKNNNT